MIIYAIIVCFDLVAMVVAWIVVRKNETAAAAPPPPPSRRSNPSPPPSLRAINPFERARRARTKVRSREFTFAFIDKGGREGWRIYILGQPSYGVRPDDGHHSHRYYDSDLRRHYICLDSSLMPVGKIEEAARWAHIWASKTVQYIDTGLEF